MSDYHELQDKLSEEDLNFARALNSLKEEVEAINWYQQRVAATEDESLKAILAHNRDEEIEHAVMTIEWLRRNMPGWDDELKTYLFSDKDIVAAEGGEEKAAETSEKPSDLGLGDTR